MEIPNSSTPPQPRAPASPRDLRDTWRPSSVPPRATTASDAAALDQRATPRTRVRHAIEFSLGGGARRAGVCRNLGLGGVAIQTAEPAAFGCRVTVFMLLDGIDGETCLGATVRWSKPGVMGVQWDSLGAHVTHAILRTAAQGP